MYQCSLEHGKSQTSPHNPKKRINDLDTLLGFIQHAKALGSQEKYAATEFLKAHLGMQAIRHPLTKEVPYPLRKNSNQKLEHEEDHVR